MRQPLRSSHSEATLSSEELVAEGGFDVRRLYLHDVGDRNGLLQMSFPSHGTGLSFFGGQGASRGPTTRRAWRVSVGRSEAIST